MRKTALVALLTIGFSGFWSAAANDHEIPVTSSRVGNRHQRGQLWTAIWSASTGPQTCTFPTADGVLGFRKHGLDVPDHRVKVRLQVEKEQEPASFRVRAWEALDSDDSPSGTGRRVEFRLKRVLAGGQTRAWAAVFRTRVDGDLYLEARGTWNDVEGCGGIQEAAWTFHLGEESD